MTSPATTYQLAQGTTIAYNSGTDVSPTWTTIARVVSFNNGLTTGEVETTVLESTIKTFVPTLSEFDASIKVQHTAGGTGATALRGLADSKAEKSWKVTYPDTSTETFTGFLKGYSKSFENEAIVEAECPMRINSTIAYAPAS